jgi:hypothetical protein
MPEMACEGCGVALLREQHAGLPTPWFATEGVMSVLAAAAGWADGYCPDCTDR